MKEYSVSVMYWEGNGDFFGDKTWQALGEVLVEATNVKEAMKKVHKNLHEEATLPEDEKYLFDKK